MKNKKIYILYKVEKDGAEQVKDITYLKEYQTQQEIAEDIKASKRDIQTMLNNNFLSNIKTHKNYCIILDTLED